MCVTVTFGRAIGDPLFPHHTPNRVLCLGHRAEALHRAIGTASNAAVQRRCCVRVIEAMVALTMRGLTGQIGPLFWLQGAHFLNNDKNLVYKKRRTKSCVLVCFGEEAQLSVTQLWGFCTALAFCSA